MIVEYSNCSRQVELEEADPCLARWGLTSGVSWHPSAARQRAVHNMLVVRDLTWRAGSAETVLETLHQILHRLLVRVNSCERETQSKNGRPGTRVSSAAADTRQYPPHHLSLSLSFLLSVSLKDKEIG